MSNQSIPTAAPGAPATVAGASVLWPAIAAAALGAALLYLVGFAGPHAIHEAAHDARHSLNFPCH